MNMAKSTIIVENPAKENKSVNVPLQWKNSNQENISNNVQNYKASFSRYCHGAGLSIKSSQNRQILNSGQQPANSHQLFDAYLQKIVKSNFDKISQLRSENQKEKENLLRQIESLKSEKNILKDKIQLLNVQISKGLFENNIQLTHSLYTKSHYTHSCQSLQELNPEKLYQGYVSITEMKERNEGMTEQVQEYRKLNSMQQVEKDNLNSMIQRLQKQSQEKNRQLQQVKKQQYNLKGQLQKIKYQHLVQKTNKQKQAQKLRRQIQLGKERLVSLSSQIQQKCQKTTPNEPIKNIQVNFADRKLIRNLQIQLKQQQSHIIERDRLIGELNQKILSSAVIGLNIKYKYLMKA